MRPTVSTSTTCDDSDSFFASPNYQIHLRDLNSLLTAGRSTPTGVQPSNFGVSELVVLYYNIKI